jgi:hypothetical protein
MFKCCNLTAPNWCQTFSGWRFQLSGRSQDTCGSGGKLFTATRAQVPKPHIDVGEPLFQEPNGFLSESYGRKQLLKAYIVLLLLLLLLLFYKHTHREAFSASTLCLSKTKIIIIIIIILHIIF